MVKNNTEENWSEKHPQITKQHPPKHTNSSIHPKMTKLKSPKHVQSTRHTPPPRHVPTRSNLEKK